MKRRLLRGMMVILLACLGGRAVACSCVDGGPFFAVAASAAWTPGYLIVRAEVLEPVSYGMDVKILGILNGNESQTVIRIWGDPGNLCRLYTNGFAKGDRLVLVLHRIEKAYYYDERAGDYELSGCGTYVVREDQRITGRISANEQNMPTNRFYRELEAILAKYSPDLARIYPVPVDRLLTVRVPELKQPTISARMINLAGQTLQTRQLDVGQQHPWDVSGLAKGVYLILFRTEHQSYTRRFIKQ